jgi:ABC-type transporter Mla subunit MlaD
MGQDQGQVGTPVDNDKTADELRQEIQDARRDLGDTAAALAAKTDVKSRAREKVENVKQTVAEKKESFASAGVSSDGGGSTQVSAAAQQAKAKAQENPVPVAAAAAFIGGFVFGRITRR